MVYDIIQTPWGSFLLGTCGDGLCLVDYQDGPKARPIDTSWERDPGTLARAGELLQDYLRGHRPGGDMPLSPRGTDFQKAVWAQLGTIPYGRTRSYKQVAEALGKPRATRAVANAIGRNPIQIFIPCHRVIGNDGNLRGYAGGLALKKKLLILEGALDGPV